MMKVMEKKNNAFMTSRQEWWKSEETYRKSFRKAPNNNPLKQYDNKANTYTESWESPILSFQHRLTMFQNRENPDKSHRGGSAQDEVGKMEQSHQSHLISLKAT